MMKYFREQCDHMEAIFLKDNPGLKHVINNYQIAKAKKNSGFSMPRRLELSRALRGDQHLLQLIQGSYLKDLQFLNLNDCRLSQKAFNELIASPQLRSLQVLLFRKNRVVAVTGPFGDLEDLDEKQRRKQLVMQLRILDLRENKLCSIFQKEAAAFLQETVVLMWDNPFADMALMAREYLDPMHLFRATSEFDDDFRAMINPLHLYKPIDNICGIS
jgi:hypothetical protein